VSDTHDAKKYTRQWEESPRAIRWLVIAVAFVIVFLAWDSLIRPVSTAWADAGDKILNSAERVHNSEDVVGKLRSLESTIIAVGDVSAPSTEAQGRAALNSAVVATLKAHPGLDNANFGLGEGGRIANVGASLVSGDQRLAAVTGDLRFEAKPETAISIISSLEKHPDIEAIRDVRLTRTDNGKVKVRLTLETWVVTKKKRSG
jgi:hypothetical protein